MRSSDPAEALRQIKARLNRRPDGPPFMDKNADWAWELIEHAPADLEALVEVAEAALEYEPAVVTWMQALRHDLRTRTKGSNNAFGVAVDDLRPKHLALLRALERLGQRAGSDAT